MWSRAEQLKEAHHKFSLVKMLRGGSSAWAQSLEISSLYGVGLGVGYLTENSMVEASSHQKLGCERKQCQDSGQGWNNFNID